MSKEKTPHGNEELEHVWNDSQIASFAAQLYDGYRNIFL